MSNTSTDFADPETSHCDVSETFVLCRQQSGASLQRLSGEGFWVALCFTGLRWGTVPMSVLLKGACTARKAELGQTHVHIDGTEAV